MYTCMSRARHQKSSTDKAHKHLLSRQGRNGEAKPVALGAGRPGPVIRVEADEEVQGAADVGAGLRRDLAIRPPEEPGYVGYLAQVGRAAAQQLGHDLARHPGQTGPEPRRRLARAGCECRARVVRGIA